MSFEFFMGMSLAFLISGAVDYALRRRAKKAAVIDSVSLPEDTLNVYRAVEVMRGEAHGYVIQKETKIPAGRVYAVLMAACSKGHMTPRWASQEEAPRRLYTLTRSGKRCLDEMMEAYLHEHPSA